MSEARNIESIPLAASKPATLADVLLTSLGTLAAAGRYEDACRLAGHGCAATRHNDPQTWRRLNALLHRLTRHRTGETSPSRGIAPPQNCETDLE